MIFNDAKWHVTKVRQAWRDIAKQEAPKYAENYGFNTHADLPNRDEVGIIGREIVREWVEAKKLRAEFSGFVPQQYGDFGDLIIDGLKCDIKTRYKNRENAKFFLYGDAARVYDHHIGKPMDVYIFCGWLENVQVGVIFGWCTRNYFLNRSYAVPKGEIVRGYPVRSAYHELELARLNQIEDFSAENIAWLMQHEGAIITRET